MRNNPYNKNLKEQMPLMMQGPSSINALISNEEQKNFVGKVMVPPKKTYRVKRVSFTMVSPPILNLNATPNTPDLLKTEMGQTEVTQELFKAVMGWNRSDNKTSPQNPVEDVTWYDCISFCNKLSSILGLEECYKISDIEMNKVHIKKAKVTWDGNKNGFRLPTEYEWEFFAKAGTDNQWSGTNDVNDLDEYAWYEKNSEDETHPVAQLRPNEWGLYDMSGNVWEWCWDSVKYHPKNERRIVRGGASWHDADACRVDRRDDENDYALFGLHGFRLCRSLG